jgi:hypothetical protein
MRCGIQSTDKTMTMDITIRPALPEENGILADTYFKM